jgi:hypothetical protein
MSDKYIIGFPRTGNHFLNCALELYSGLTREFKTPMIRNQSQIMSFIPRSNDFAWHQSHAFVFDAIVPKTPFLYIFREPSDVCYSYTAVQRNTTKIETVIYTLWSYRMHMKRLGKDENAILVSYERLTSDFHQTFKTALSFLGLEYDYDKAEKVRLDVAKEKMVALCPKEIRPWFRPYMLTQTYAEKRIEFQKVWQDQVGRICGSVFEELKTKEARQCPRP